MSEIDDRFDALRFLANSVPPDIKKMQEYERNDPAFAQLVKSLSNMITQLHLSPSEVRAAGMYACYKAEMMAVRPTFMQTYMREKGDL